MLRDDTGSKPQPRLGTRGENPPERENGRRCAGPPALRIERVPIVHPDAAQLIEEVQAEYVALYGIRDETPIEAIEFEDPEGAFFVGYVDGSQCATGAWRRRDEVVVDGSSLCAEVKRMYVAPGMRRMGFGRRMLAHLEDSARAAGTEVMLLETGRRQPAAIELYESSGYRQIEGFGFHRDEPLALCMARRLLPLAASQAQDPASGELP